MVFLTSKGKVLFTLAGECITSGSHPFQLYYLSVELFKTIHMLFHGKHWHCIRLDEIPLKLLFKFGTDCRDYVKMWGQGAGL